MGASTSAALAEAVTSIAALRRCTLRRFCAVLWALDCLPFAIYVGAIVRTFRLRLLFLRLLLCWSVG